jgi:hypothetical protein
MEVVFKTTVSEGYPGRDVAAELTAKSGGCQTPVAKLVPDGQPSPQVPASSTACVVFCFEDRSGILLIQLLTTWGRKEMRADARAGTLAPVGAS